MAGSSSPRYVGLDLFRPVAAYGLIFYHFYLMGGSHPSLHWVNQLRDCTFSFFVISSFFVLTISFKSHHERSLRKFLLSRSQRIWVPCIIWTVLYLCFWNIFAPLIKREPINWSSFLPSLLCGYSHLWFLQFIFMSSLPLAPLLRFFARNKEFHWQFSILSFTSGLLLFFLRPLLIDHINWAWLPQMVRGVEGFMGAIINYLPSILLAIAIGLLADEIETWYRHRLFRTLTLLAVAAWLAIYLEIPTIKFGKEIYSFAVFIALLRPLTKLRFRSFYTIAKYSYAVYILSMWVLMIAWSVLYRAGIDKTPGIVLSGSAIVFGLSLLSSVLLRRLFPYDWLLPLIPINYRTEQSLEFRGQAGIFKPRCLL